MTWATPVKVRPLVNVQRVVVQNSEMKETGMGCPLGQGRMLTEVLAVAAAKMASKITNFNDIFN